MGKQMIRLMDWCARCLSFVSVGNDDDILSQKAGTTSPMTPLFSRTGLGRLPPTLWRLIILPK